MIWTVELARYLDDAPWPATILELVEYADRIGAPYEVIENLKESKENEDEEEEEIYESIDDLWPDRPTDEDYFSMDADEYT